MKELVELGKKLDWYGAFLTERQRSIVSQYVEEDCSLSEIAEREGITRQAVRDAIARTDRELSEMEAKLRLVSKAAQMQRILADMRLRTGDPALLHDIDRLTNILEDDDGI